MVIRPSAEMIQAIGKYKNGNAQAFEVIYNISLPYLSKCVLNVTNRTAPDASEDLIQDILQDTYMSVAEKMDTLQNEEAFFQWAGQIATNHALRTWSKSTRQKEQERSEDELLYDIPDERFIPEDILENKEKQRLIRQMIQELPTGQYLCLVEYFYNGLKETEIAEKLDMPLGTVKTNLFRAKKKMKQIVQTHEKKHGVKLYSMSWLLLLLFWDEIKDAFAGTGVVLTEATGAATAAGAGTAVTGAGTSAGTATGLTAKIITGVVAASIVLSGAGALLHNAVGKKADRNQGPDSPEITVADMEDPHTDIEEDKEQLLQTTPEETPAQTGTGDIILTAEDLLYINQIANRSVLAFTSVGAERPDYEDVRVSTFLAGCAGTEGLLKGTKTENGLQVTKTDLEAFLMDTRGVAVSVGESEYSPVQKLDEDTYLIPHYTGDQDIPISIHNLSAVDQNTILVTVSVESHACTCTFKRDSASRYGWILTSVKNAMQNISESNVMTAHVFSAGVVLPANGAEVLTGISFSGELTKEAALAYVKQYLLESTGNLPSQITVEDWGLVANGYYTYKICGKDSGGNIQYSFLIGTSDSAIFNYDEATGQMEEISWKLRN